MEERHSRLLASPRQRPGSSLARLRPTELQSAEEVSRWRPKPRTQYCMSLPDTLLFSPELNHLQPRKREGVVWKSWLATTNRTLSRKLPRKPILQRHCPVDTQLSGRLLGRLLKLFREASSRPAQTSRTEKAAREQPRLASHPKLLLRRQAHPPSQSKRANRFQLPRPPLSRSRTKAKVWIDR